MATKARRALAKAALAVTTLREPADRVDPADCRDPDHKRPPHWFHLPPDLYHHVCPNCGMERWLDTRPVQP